MSAISRVSAGNLGPSPAGTSCISKSLRGNGVTVRYCDLMARERHPHPHPHTRTTFSYLVISACPTLAVNESKAVTRANTQRPIRQ